MPAFAPAPGRGRRDGWSAGCQAAFVVALAAGHGVAAAARSVGRSRQSAYALRCRPGAEEFAAAWDRSVLIGAGKRPPCIPPARPDWKSATEGVLKPVIYRGRKVGERRVYDDRALVKLLRAARARRLRAEAGNFER